MTRHGYSLVALGLVLISVGVIKRSWLLLLCWLGIDFLAVGFAHIAGVHWIFGKRKDRTLPFWSWTAFLPFFAYTTIVWHLVRLVSREPKQNTVTPELVVGRRLIPSEIEGDFENYIDLTAEFSEPARIRRKRGYSSFPILDASAPEPAALIAAVRQLPRGRTFIHCAQGHGRTGLFALAVLLRNGIAHNVADGLRILQHARPKIILNRTQLRCIQNAEAELLSSTPAGCPQRSDA